MTCAPDKLPAPLFFTHREVCVMLGITRPSLYAWIRDPETGFPAAVRLGPNTVRFRRAEVDAWLAARPTVMPGDLQGGG